MTLDKFYSNECDIVKTHFGIASVVAIARMYTKGSLSKAEPTNSTGSTRLTQVEYYFSASLRFNKGSSYPHFSRGPSFTSFLLPFIFRRLNINAVLPASNVKSRCTSVRVAFSSSYALSLCALFAALYLNFPRVCETQRRRRDGHANYSLVRAFFSSITFTREAFGTDVRPGCFRVVLARKDPFL